MRRYQLTTPREKSSSGIPVVSWGAYEGSLKQGIAALKYSRQVELSQFLGFELGRIWIKHYPPKFRQNQPLPIVVPIPLHTTRQQERGFNQAELLAQWFCHFTKLPLAADGLLRIQATCPQHSLSYDERQKNLTRAFAVNPKQLPQLRRTSVWLLDDIYTTGATAHAAAQTLRRYRVSVAGICTVARAIAREPRHS
jgi:ComF family protein